MSSGSVLALSAVPGEAALSCGGALMTLVGRSWRVLLATPDPGEEDHEFGRRASLAAVHPLEDVASLRALVAEHEPQLVLGPQALGDEPARAALLIAMQEAGADVRGAWYREVPAAIRDPAARPSPRLPAGLPEFPFEIGAVLERKLDAVAAYASRVRTEFGDEAAMRSELTAFARSEAAYAGRTGSAELLSVMTASALPERSR